MAVSKMAVAAMVGTALASNLATIAPCTQKPGLYQDEIVTAQFQEVSYCVPSQTIEYSTSTMSGYGTSKITVTSTITTTVYPLASTSVYVSTTIPCAYDGTKALSSCTVTTTNENVDCRETSSTITSLEPYQTTTVYPITVTPGAGKYGYGNQTYGNATTSYTTKTTTSTRTHYTTVSKHYDAEFNQIGGWVIPGFSGSPINTKDVPDAAGNKYQPFNVTACTKVDNGTFACSKYAETWTSTKAPSTSAVYSTAVSTHATASSAGTYSYTFTQTAPGMTYTASSSTITAPPQTWHYTMTKTCTGPTTWDVTTTISKTVTYTCPYEHPTSTGGSYPTGGQPTGGYPTGGHPTGGYPTGGYPTGGNPTGGYPTGGYPTGGNPTSGGSYPTSSCKGEFKLAVVDASARFQKSNFVGFDGDDATVSDATSGAVFSFDSAGNLQTGSDYISTSGSSQYAPFEKSSTQPGSYSKYTVDASGNLQLAGAKGFCQKDDAIMVVYGGAPYGCNTVNLQKKDVAEPGCATTTYATTTTTGSMTTYTTSVYSTPDISGDMGTEPTSTPGAYPTYGTYKNKRYVIRAQ